MSQSDRFYKCHLKYFKVFSKSDQLQEISIVKSVGVNCNDAGLDNTNSVVSVIV